MIEMHVRPTLGITPFGHNNSGARLLTPLGVGTIVIRVIKVDASYGRCVLMFSDLAGTITLRLLCV